MTRNRIELLVVGAGPTGISIGAEARRAGLSTLLVDRGPLVAALLDFPVDMTFFTTRERLEVAGIPFTVPDDKPNRRQAIVYYQAVAKTYDLPIARHEDVVAIRPQADGEFLVETSSPGTEELPGERRGGRDGLLHESEAPRCPGEDLLGTHAVPRSADPFR
ncbi:MAG: NAD(P)-binding domain-containing protein [Thermoanaerobaculia bacterium]